MILTLQETKEYLRLEDEYTHEDNLLNGFIAAADEYLKTGVGTEIYNKIVLTENEEYVNKGKLQQAKIYCLALITEWYDSRKFTANTTEGTSLVLQILATQLKYGWES
ncbi:putative phage protein (predicted DNA packaging) [Acetoanaerobium pronyense]|uniref:Phage protein (Predicted DNA packaging) n=1 Tax=Acetoanaerobium pronyense TaxID=1482736 RepID=A0ABS4KJ99_9FIRM|nr:head-tail connector protein [Acetoanaerobium pronyense]MBP2027405.1 putative phage protein (predicted DNA packaging) [Acetoanaerobium pronyense]